MLLQDEIKNSKHVLIVDGVGNGGKEMIATFTGRGARAAFLFQDQFKEALNLARHTGALNVKCNIKNTESLASAGDVLREFFDGQMDTLICNPGIDLNVTQDEEGWTNVPKLFQSNFEGYGFCIHQMLPLMVKGGSILLILPTQEADDVEQKIALRILRKGLEELIASAAEELKERDIRINGIRVKASEQGPAAGSEDSWKAAAKLARFLSSKEADAVTGQIIEV